MPKFNKFLILISILLIFIIGGETYVLLMYKNNPQLVIPNVQPTPTVGPVTSYVNDITKTVGYLINDGYAGNITNLNINYTSTGTLLNVDFDKQNLENYRAKAQPSLIPAFLLNMNTENNKLTHLMFYESELPKITYYTQKDGKLSKISLNDLKKGDKISVSVTLNLLQPPTNNLIEGKIIKTL